ncbi:MAG: hypothetical protein WBO10_04140 [Pyrinomonadaceae bacterium]
MKLSVFVVTFLALFLALESDLYAQKASKAKPKSAPTANAVKTKPVTNPGYIGETEKNLSKGTPAKKPAAGVVFEPNDEPRTNSSVPGGTAQPKKSGKIMDIFDPSGVKTDGPNSSQPNAQPVTSTPPKKGIAVAELNKRPKKPGFGDIVVSSKSSKSSKGSKARSKPAKSKTKRKPK